MSFVVTFEGYLPAPRHDQTAWTAVRIEQGDTKIGPWTPIDTQSIEPAPDPADPPEYDFTTELASLFSGWYRVVFLDDEANESATDGVFRAAVPDDPRRPSVDDVALLLRTRTVKGSGSGLGGDTGSGDFTTFDAGTRPTDSEASAIIGSAYSAMLARLQVPLIESQHGAFSHLVGLYAATLIEVSFFRESANQVLLQMWADEITAGLQAIAVRTEREQPATKSTTPGFGTLKLHTDREKVAPLADVMEGIDF